MEVLKWFCLAMILIFAGIALVKWLFLVVKLITLNVKDVSSLDTDFSTTSLLIAGFFGGLWLVCKNGVHSDGWWISLVCLIGIIPFASRYIRVFKENRKGNGNGTFTS